MKESTNISKLKKQIKDNVAVNDEIVCDLCDQLITEATKLDDGESIAFAYVWKADYYFYVEPDQTKLFEYLTEAGKHIDEEHASTLLEKYYTLFRLYHHSFADYKTSLAYALKGLKIAEQLHDESRIATYYGIIGEMYLDYECYSQALYYFNESLSMLDHDDSNNFGTLRLILVSLFDCLIKSNKFDYAKQTLDYLSNIKLEQSKLKIYIDRCAMIYYSYIKDEDKTNMYAQELLKDGAFEFVNTSFAFDFISCLYDSMMRIDNQKEAEKALKMLREMTKEHDYYNLLKIANFQIQFNVRYHPENLADSYKEYYHYYTKDEARLDQIKIGGLHAKITLHERFLEQTKMSEKMKSMEDEANLDGLTKVHNRRFMNSQLSSILQNKKNKNIGLIIIDIDFFKEYNDTYGHLKGDIVLQELANIMRNHCSTNLEVCRYGGDEFVCICENSSLANMRSYIEKIQSSLYLLNIKHSGSLCSDRVTLSIGYGIHELPMAAHIFSFFEDVDLALYQAKEKGRNNVVALNEESEGSDHERK